MIVRKKAPYGGTKVDPDSTIAEINQFLRGYGVKATQWSTAYDKGKVQVRFPIEIEKDKFVTVSIEPRAIMRKRRVWDEKLRRTVEKEFPEWPQTMRLVWWYIKSKVEAIAYGLVTAEEAFLADIEVQLPSGEFMTVAEALREHLPEGKLALPGSTKEALEEHAFEGSFSSLRRGVE